MRRLAGHALKGLAFLFSPFFFGGLVATVHGWTGLASNGRLLASWILILAFSILLPIFLFRAARAAIGHETEAADRGALSTGIAVAAVGTVAAVLAPWHELARWLAATLSELTGFSLLPAGAP